jgi:hypothetical protein
MYEKHDTVGLNNYERKYFQKHFGTNIKRLIMLRKKVSREQSSPEEWHKGTSVGTIRTFRTKGGKNNSIWLTRKKIDAYIREIKEL